MLKLCNGKKISSDYLKLKLRHICETFYVLHKKRGSNHDISCLCTTNHEGKRLVVQGFGRSFPAIPEDLSLCQLISRPGQILSYVSSLSFVTYF